MKAFQKLSLVVTGVLFLTACSKEVTVEAIPGFNPNFPNPSGPVVTEGRTGVFTQAYQNPYGTIAFSQADAATVHVLRSCTTDSYLCAAMETEASTDFMIRLNDSSSVYTHTVGSETWETHGAGSANALILSTVVRDQNGQQLRLVEDTFKVSDDPCGYGMGKGLEDSQTVRTTYFEDGYEQEVTSDSCQAYY